MRIISCLLSLLLFSACSEWQVEKLIVEPEEVLVLNAALTADDTVNYVYVGRASSITTNQLSISELSIKDAEVSISDGNNFTNLIFNKTKNLYEIKTKDLQIKEGKQYTVRAKTNKRTIAGTCSIPAKAQNITIETQRAKGEVTGTISWSSQGNIQYFKLIGEAFGITQSGVPQFTNLGWDYNELDLIEATKPNQRLQQQFLLKESIFISPAKEIEIKIDVVSYDPNGQKFLESIKNAFDRPQFQDGFFERFSSPTIRYTNVENGIGIVLGYSKEKVAKILK